MKSIFRKTAIISCILSTFWTATVWAANMKRIKNMQIITGSAGGTWEVVGVAIASRVNEHFEGFPFTAVPGPGSVANPMVVASGESAFGLSYPNFLVAATKGEFPYDKAVDNLCAIASMPATVLHIYVDSRAVPVATLEDVVKKKIAFRLGLPPQGAGSYMIFHSIMNVCGLKNVEDIEEWGCKIYPATGQGLNDAWKNRMIDGSVMTFNIPAAIIEEALSARSGVLLSMGNGLMPKLEEMGFTPVTIPAKTYAGQKSDVVTVGLPMVLFTRADISEDIIYLITKTLYENANFMKTVHSSFSGFNPDTMSEGNGIVLHPGAIKFYKEKGIM